MLSRPSLIPNSWVPNSQAKDALYEASRLPAGCTLVEWDSGLFQVSCLFTPG